MEHRKSVLVERILLYRPGARGAMDAYEDSESPATNSLDAGKVLAPARENFQSRTLSASEGWKD